MHDSTTTHKVKVLNTVHDWEHFATKRRLKHAKSTNCIVIRADSRKLLPEIPSNSISCGITSPPYGELKDYGSPRQIGFGQDIVTEYIPDLHQIFKELFRITKSGGAFWVVLDMLRHAGETVVLPWEVISIAKEAGWTFHDLVVWDKGKSLPWPNPGRFRGVCEYILLLGKGKLKRFDLDGVRDSEHLSPYWVKYPERYHPDGKAPSDLWHFPIPNQGTWSGTNLNHACPFPVGLIERMISITTRPGDTVLDPFSGSGSVPTIAGHLGRIGVGIEINTSLVEGLKKDNFSSLRSLIEAEFPLERQKQNGLRGFIVQLRMQKYAKTLYAALVRADELGAEAETSIGAFLIRSPKFTSTGADGRIESGDLGKMILTILLQEGADLNKILTSIEARCKKQPLSLFGLSVKIEIIEWKKWSKADFFNTHSEVPWFAYHKGKFYSYDREIAGKDLHANILLETANRNKGVPTILSEIKLNLESPPKDSISL